MNQKKWSKTRITDLLKINYPIVQGPFGGGVSSVALTTTISELGGLGSLGCQPYTASEIVAYSKAIRDITNKPFNLNLWVNDWDAAMEIYNGVEYAKLVELFRPYYNELGVAPPEMPTDLGPRYENQVEAILETKPPVFSFMFGIPDEEILEQCRRNGTLLIGTATTVDEAIALEKAGVDAIVASGFEAGGHRSSFLRKATESLMGSFSLIPQVADRVSVPVIAAGGIADGRGIAAALVLGADAVQIGTAFVGTAQSNASAGHKEKLFSPAAKYTSLTRMYSGRLARVMTSRLMEDLKDKEDLFAPYPMQRKFMSLFSKEATRQQRTEYLNFAAGQSSSLLKYKDARELFLALVEETDKILSWA